MSMTWVGVVAEDLMPSAGFTATRWGWPSWQPVRTGALGGFLLTGSERPWGLIVPALAHQDATVRRDDRGDDRLRCLPMAAPLEPGAYLERLDPLPQLAELALTDPPVKRRAAPVDDVDVRQRHMPGGPAARGLTGNLQALRQLDYVVAAGITRQDECGHATG